MKIKPVMITAVLVLSAATALFITLYQDYAWTTATDQVHDHADVVASSLWTFETSSPTAYLTLAAKANGYRRVTVTDTEGRVFLDIAGPPPNAFDAVLLSAGAIPVYRLESGIRYENQRIGAIVVEWPCRAVYLYVVVGLYIVLLLAGIWLVMKLLESKRTLEIRVLERTEALEAEIRERRRAEEALRQAMLVVESSPAMLFRWKAEEGWPVVLVSQNVTQIGYTQEDLLSGKVPFSAIVHPEDLERIRREVKTYSEAGVEGFRQEYRIVARDGKIRWVYDRTAVERDDRGRITHYQGIVMDISEKRRLEEQLVQSQKMEAIGTLASGIAHDFNNILGAVIGYAELALMETPEGAGSRKNLEMVLTAGERAKDLVKQILAFSRQGKEERKPVEIARIVNEVIKFMRASLPSTIEIKKRLGSDIDNILADPVQVQQVLMNLCTNAHHAMGETGGVLDIGVASVELGIDFASVHPDLKPGRYVSVTVRDSGHGMDAATREKIFDPYFTTKEKGVGTGLGLSVVHGIVQKHEGAIVVESTPGKGSAFSLYFPAIDRAAAREPAVKADLPTGSEHVLLVDDEKLLVDIGRQMLASLGYTVDSRTSSVDALALFAAHPQRFDLVITDLTMPNLTGDKLALEMMRIRPDIPVVLCTGYSDRAMEDGARAIGIRAFVMKPILMADLARAARSAIDGVRQGGR